MRQRIGMALLALSACARKPAEIGTEVTRISFECLKMGDASGVGVSDKGDFMISSHDYCQLTRCIRRTTRLARYEWNDVVVSKDILDDRMCLK